MVSLLFWCRLVSLWFEVWYRHRCYFGFWFRLASLRFEFWYHHRYYFWDFHLGIVAMSGFVGAGASVWFEFRYRHRWYLVFVWHRCDLNFDIVIVAILSPWYWFRFRHRYGLGLGKLLRAWSSCCIIFIEYTAACVVIIVGFNEHHKHHKHYQLHKYARDAQEGEHRNKLVGGQKHT